MTACLKAELKISLKIKFKNVNKIIKTETRVFVNNPSFILGIRLSVLLYLRGRSEKGY